MDVPLRSCPPRRARAAVALLLLALAFLPACDREDPATTARTWLNQLDGHENACGPTSILNALTVLRPKVRFGETPRASILGLIDTYGDKASVEYDEAVRWDPKTGVAPLDLLAWYNDVRGRHDLEPARGQFLDRKEDEALDAHLRRVHRVIASSLDQGEPVLLRLRTFAPEDMGEGLLWQGRVGHYVLVVGVRRGLRAHERGFAIDFVDPAGGKLRSGYVHPDVDRNFTAAKGNTKTWTWLSDRPFLVLAAPELDAMRRGDEPWHRRVVLTVDYAIGRPLSADEHGPSIPVVPPLGGPTRPEALLPQAHHVALTALPEGPQLHALVSDLQARGIQVRRERAESNQFRLLIRLTDYPQAVVVMARSDAFARSKASDFAALLDLPHRNQPPRGR